MIENVILNQEHPDVGHQSCRCEVAYDDAKPRISIVTRYKLESSSRYS